jgi:serralysin
MSRRNTLAAAALVALLGPLPVPANAAFHLWHVKEVFSNADGSVQFIELFNNFGGEQFVGGHTLRSNSDGVIRNFAIPSNLPNSPSTANTHFLVATPGFSSLAGAVTPNYTLPDPNVSGPFFNPNAANITITFVGSGDSLSFAGSILPKDGFHSLTDGNATGSGTPDISVTPNTPTRFPNTSGQIDLRPPMLNGDYNGDGKVDAADYVVWRKNGINGLQGYNDWRANFGSTAPGAVSAVPEPTTLVGALVPLCLLMCRRRRAH